MEGETVAEKLAIEEEVIMVLMGAMEVTGKLVG